MVDLFDLLIDAGELAGIFALVSIGFVVMFRATGIVSFAQGSFMLLGPVIFYYIVGGNTSTGSMVLALVAAMVLTGLLSAASYIFCFARLAGGDAFVTSIATIGFGFLLQYVIIMIFGSTPRPAPPLVSVGGFVLRADVTVPWATVFVLASAGGVVGALVLYLYGTRMGLSMRAVANRPLLASQAGLNVRVVSATAWGIAGATAALAGTGYALTGQIDPGAIPDLGLLAFPALILGGLNSLGGTVIAAAILGLVEGATIIWIGGPAQDIVAYGVMILVILVRPSGLFGSQEVARL